MSNHDAVYETSKKIVVQTTCITLDNYSRKHIVINKLRRGYESITLATWLLTGLGFILFPAITGCSDSTHAQYRAQISEELIRRFYVSNHDRLQITSVIDNLLIDAYCVLEPYEDRLNDKEDLAIQANAFLKQIDLLPDEDYWHLVVKSSGRFTLLRISQHSFPLLTPKASNLKSSCVVGKKLEIKKSGSIASKHQTLIIGN